MNIGLKIRTRIMHGDGEKPAPSQAEPRRQKASTQWAADKSGRSRRFLPRVFWIMRHLLTDGGYDVGSENEGRVLI